MGPPLDFAGMTHAAEPSRIRLFGVRQNNLKGFDLDLPLGKLIVFSGLSGSGKSSLAFETLYAEGQRRYIETFSPYARQFFDRMDKPAVDRVEGIPPAIAIEQRNAVRTTRSTVGTMTEICDHMKQVWPWISALYCPGCDRRVHSEPPPVIWDKVLKSVPGSQVLVTFEVPVSQKLSLADSLDLVGKQGFRRLWIEPTTKPARKGSKAALNESPVPYGRDASPVTRLEEALSKLEARPPKALEVVQDRIRIQPDSRARFMDACEQAYHFGKGRLRIRVEEDGEVLRFSRDLHCPDCDREFRSPSPALFSFNHPLGACPECRGFGRVITIDYRLALPDPSLTLAGGAVKPWQTEQGAQCQKDLVKAARKEGVPMDVPFRELTTEQQRWVIEGDPDYGEDAAHRWPKAWYGVAGYFRWLESKAYKMHVRVLLSRYRSYKRCDSCQGKRLQPEALTFQAPGPESGTRLSLPDFYALTIRDARQWILGIQRERSSDPKDPVGVALGEVARRLGFLDEVGLGYITLDRTTRTLSGGETERVNLTSCLGTRLVNTLYVLDEPSVGLHPRDTHRLIGILQQLRDEGNTVVVVEHEPSVIQAADHIVDLGPRQGEQGGEIVHQGNLSQLLKSRKSLTGRYLSGNLRVDAARHRPVDDSDTPWLQVEGATRNNLRQVDVSIPLGRLVCLTGVSGSGKSTLMRDVLLPALEQRIRHGEEGSADTENDGDNEATETLQGESLAGISGWESLSEVVLVDQSSIGKTPRSTPVVYVGVFNDLRDLYARTPEAKELGLQASAFSFNSAHGQCERCRGAGFEKIEMQFLSDVFIRCPDCAGRRYRSHVDQVRLPHPDGRQWSIADLLEASVDEVQAFLEVQPASRPRDRALSGLGMLQRVGLGYLRPGQPVNTLSGGECQRLKLARRLADFARSRDEEGARTLFLFDEPTTGLHFEDVRILLEGLQLLVDQGHSVLVIEHNTDFIRCADWVVDLGPEAGEEGGRVVAQGTPAQVALMDTHTGAALRADS